MPAVGQLVDHGVQPVPVPAPSVSQPLALYVPEGHANVPVAQPPPPPPHVLVTAPVHVPVEHTQPKESDEDVELAGHVFSHAVATVEPTLIGLAWNAPGAHEVQVTLAVVVPSAETEVPAVGQTVAHVPTHAVAAVEPTLIGLAWNVPDAHAVQSMSAVELPGVE